MKKRKERKKEKKKEKKNHYENTVLKQKVDAGSIRDRCRADVVSMWWKENKNKK